MRAVWPSVTSWLHRRDAQQGRASQQPSCKLCRIDGKVGNRSAEQEWRSWSHLMLQTFTVRGMRHGGIELKSSFEVSLDDCFGTDM